MLGGRRLAAGRGRGGGREPTRLPTFFLRWSQILACSCPQSSPLRRLHCCIAGGVDVWHMTRHSDSGRGRVWHWGPPPNNSPQTRVATARARAPARFRVLQGPRRGCQALGNHLGCGHNLHACVRGPFPCAGRRPWQTRQPNECSSPNGHFKTFKFSESPQDGVAPCRCRPCPLLVADFPGGGHNAPAGPIPVSVGWAAWPAPCPSDKRACADSPPSVFEGLRLWARPRHHLPVRPCGVCPACSHPRPRPVPPLAARRYCERAASPLDRATPRRPAAASRREGPAGSRLSLPGFQTRCSLDGWARAHGRHGRNISGGVICKLATRGCPSSY